LVQRRGADRLELGVETFVLGAVHTGADVLEALSLGQGGFIPAHSRRVQLGGDALGVVGAREHLLSLFWGNGPLLLLGLRPSDCVQASSPLLLAATLHAAG